MEIRQERVTREDPPRSGHLVQKDMFLVRCEICGPVGGWRDTLLKATRASRRHMRTHETQLQFEL